MNFEQIRNDNKRLFMEISKMPEKDRSSARFEEIKAQLSRNNQDLQAISKMVGDHEPRLMRYKGGKRA